MNYNEFCEIVRAGIASGEVKTTAEEIYFLIGKHCGADVQNRLFSD